MKKLVALILTFLLILTGCNTVEVTKVKDDNKADAIKFHEDYPKVKKDNVYEYSTYNNIIETLESDTGIIYLGFPSCALCKEIVPILNDSAKEKKIEKILYYNFKDIRENNTEEYQRLTKLLSDYTKVDEEGTKRISAPTVIFVNKGTIVGIYTGTINSDGEEIISLEEKQNLHDNFISLIDKMLIENVSE